MVVASVVRGERESAPVLRAILKRFLALEDRAGADILCEAAQHRRFGERTMEFNCFDAVIDAGAGTVTIEEIIGEDAIREVIRTRRASPRAPRGT